MIQRVKDFMSWLDEEHELVWAFSMTFGAVLVALATIFLLFLAIDMAIEIHFLWWVYICVVVYLGFWKLSSLLDEYKSRERKGQ